MITNRAETGDRKKQPMGDRDFGRDQRPRMPESQRNETARSGEAVGRKQNDRRNQKQRLHPIAEKEIGIGLHGKDDQLPRDIIPELEPEKQKKQR